MQIRYDNYNLSKSNKLEIFSGNLDIKADVILTNNEKDLKIDSSISGTVVDTLNNPIKNALIKLINGNLDSLASVRTDENGKYIMNIVPSSTIYTILATSVEKIVNQSPSFTLKTGENKIINFTLSNDPNALFGAISGTLINNNNTPLKGAIISLYKTNEISNELFAITYSDLQGTFLFSELLPGKYKLSIASITNISYEEIIIIKSREIYNFNKSLSFNYNLNDGSISGTITDNLGNTITNADVILYKVENNIKTPVAFTKTNTFGLYSFGNVPFGSYLVKSNATQSLDVNNVTSPSVKVTSTTELDTYNLSKGVLENGALVDYNTGIVTSLGGKNDGAVTLSINTKSYGLYTLALYYLSADFNRSLKVEVNGKDLGETYKLPITPGWTVEDMKIFHITATLNEGINTIKFHGDSINLSPNLNMVTLIFNTTENSPMFTSTFAISDSSYFKSIAIEGAYSNGAKYNNESLLATGIGGSKDGAVTLQIYIRDTALYYMTIKYIATSPNLKLKVDVNNDANNNIYTLPLTDSLTSKAFILPVELDRGNNTIKFHGDGKNQAPDLDSFILKLPPLTQKLIEGTLENEATIDENKTMVLGIGGTKNGAVTVSVNVANFGYYSILLDYVNGTATLPLKVDVNAINGSTLIFPLAKTKSSNIADKKSFEFILKLNSGNNTIRFSGNGKDSAPNLLSFITSFKSTYLNQPLLTQDVYNINNVKLNGSATLDTKANLITSLGGKSKGYFTLDINIKYVGEYILRIVYKNNRNFKIDINGKWTGKVYTTIGGLRDVFSVPITFTEQKNTIKFYGNGDELAPDIGDIYVDLNYPLTKRLIDGLFVNGCDFFPPGIISPIGGPDNSSYTLYYFAPEYAEYSLNLILSTVGRSLLININDVNTETIYSIPPSKTPTIAYNINVVLNNGDNFIEFQGNGADYAPDIYSIDIKPIFSDVSKFTYNLVDATLKNGATIDLNKNFVQNLGGKSKGSALLTVKIDTEDYYDINIQYIPLTISSSLKLSVNNKPISEIYYLPLLKNLYSNTIKIFKIPKILLTKGNNTLEFYSNGTSPVAKLGKIRISKFIETATLPDGVYFAVNGKLENGAKKASFSPNFVEGIGGVTQNGSVTIKVNVETDDFYDLLIEYLATSKNKDLFVIINGDQTENLYTLPVTDGIKEEFSKYLSISVMLKKGENTIRFNGSNSTFGPNLGKIYVNKSSKATTYNFSNAILKEAEMKDYPENFISLIGTIGKSLASVKVNISSEGIYYLTIKYLSRITSYVDLMLNDTIVKSKITFPATKSENTIDSKFITVSINFLKGENILTFVRVNDLKFPPPLLGTFVISKNKLVYYLPIYKAILLKGASFNKQTKFIQGLGGLGNGSAIINVKVLQSGLYDMTFDYISLKYPRKLKITINDITLSKTFVLPMTENSSKVFTIPVTLKQGVNSIKFHGDRNSWEGPMIDELTLSLNTINPIKHYNLVDGIVSGGAIIDKIENFVSNIGGKNNGSITMKVNVPTSNIYDLEVWYRDPSVFNKMFISVNDEVQLENKSLEFNDNINKINTQLRLTTGDNFIKFFGDTEHTGFIVYDFTLSVNEKESISLNSTNYLSFNLTSGELINGATLNKNNTFVTNLGGKKNGTVFIKVSVEYAGEYSLIVECLFKGSKISDANTLVIDVNYNSSGNIFSFIINSYKSTIMKHEALLQLKKGINTIIFKGNGKHQVPDLGNATLTLKSKSK